MPFSDIPDIGRHAVRLDEDLLDALGVVGPRPDLAVAQLAEELADYLGQARVMDSLVRRGGRRPTDVLSDGTWLWLRPAAHYARSYRVADVRLFVNAFDRGFVLPEGWVNPDAPRIRRTTAAELDRIEFATWRDHA